MLCMGIGSDYSILSSPANEKPRKSSVYEAFLCLFTVLCANVFCTMQSRFSKFFATKFATNSQNKFSVIIFMD